MPRYPRLCDRMPEKASNRVLASKTSSTYPTGYASGIVLVCGLAWDKARLDAPGLGG
jgi:hypothetical protein